MMSNGMVGEPLNMRSLLEQFAAEMGLNR